MVFIFQDLGIVQKKPETKVFWPGKNDWTGFYWTG